MTDKSRIAERIAYIVLVAFIGFFGLVTAWYFRMINSGTLLFGFFLVMALFFIMIFAMVVVSFD